MRILVVTQFYYPEPFRVHDVCTKLVEHGHSVSVFTTFPNYPQGDIYPDYQSQDCSYEVVDGVEVHRIKTSPRGHNIFQLAQSYFSFWFRGKHQINKIFRNKLFDVIYVYQVSPVTQAFPAIKFARKRKIPLYLYCLDIWPECFRELSDDKILSFNNPIYLLIKRLSAKAYRSADCIGVKCKEFADYLVKTCKVKREKCKILFEHAESNYLSVPKDITQNGCIDFMFLGNIGGSSNCLTILKATEALKETNPYKIHFVGDGSALEGLKTYVNEHHMEEHVVFHGRFPQSEIMRFYEYADVCLLTLSNKTAVGLTPPAKMVGYMAAARPILGAINGAAKKIVSDAKCGIIVDADDVHGLSAHMQSVIDNPQNLIGLGENGRNFFMEHFTIEHHVSKLEKQLNQLIGGSEDVTLCK